MTHPHKHLEITKRLAKKLRKKDVYDWFVTTGYYPESYVLPPCFKVTTYPTYGKIFSHLSKSKFAPPITEIVKIHFPKTDLTDRTFGIIDPEIHSDIAYFIAEDWKKVTDTLFHKDNKICSYSFPIPINSKTPGKIGKLRSGRMIYEFIEMAENDLASIAYDYQVLIKTDIKNFYPSIYTHSVAWALHNKNTIRKLSNRFNNKYLGNKLDKLLQNANDGKTNGIAVGPAISDLISEIVLARADREISNRLTKESIDATIVRFKDDYRILCNHDSEGERVVKIIQTTLKEYNLELNDEKTQQFTLPDGLFRDWVSLYHAANSSPKRLYNFKYFKEVYLAVIKIDKQHPGTGIIDRFLADITDKKGVLKVKLNSKTLSKTISLLLLLARRRIKAFPRILAIIEAVLKTQFGKYHTQAIATHLGCVDICG